MVTSLPGGQRGMAGQPLAGGGGGPNGLGGCSSASTGALSEAQTTIPRNGSAQQEQRRASRELWLVLNPSQIKIVMINIVTTSASAATAAATTSSGWPSHAQMPSAPQT